MRQFTRVVITLLFAIALTACGATTPEPTATMPPALTIAPPTSTPPHTPTTQPTDTPIATPTQVEATPTGTPPFTWKGLPIMPQATSGEDQQSRYGYTVGVTPNEVKAFYEEEMSKLGWQVLDRMSVGGAWFLKYQKDGTQADIAALPGDKNSARVSIGIAESVAMITSTPATAAPTSAPLALDGVQTIARTGLSVSFRTVAGLQPNLGSDSASMVGYSRPEISMVSLQIIGFTDPVPSVEEAAKLLIAMTPPFLVVGSSFPVQVGGLRGVGYYMSGVDPLGQQVEGQIVIALPGPQRGLYSLAYGPTEGWKSAGIAIWQAVLASIAFSP